MATVTRNQSSKCTAYRQDDSRWEDYTFKDGSTIGEVGCAMTCVGMCLKKSPKTIYNDGFTSSTCDWSGIGSYYGKTLYTATATLSNLASTLSNYPAIVGVGGHFVVVYKFIGDPAAPQKDNFSVHDPARSDGTLDRTAYSDITSIRYYK